MKQNLFLVEIDGNVGGKTRSSRYTNEMEGRRTRILLVHFRVKEWIKK